MKLGHLYKTIDFVLIVSAVILIAAGIAVILSLAQGGAKNLSFSQSTFAAIGLAVAGVLTFTDYRAWKSLSWWLYIFGVASLALVLALGATIFGASRWIDFGFFQFQPSELMKLILIIIISRLLGENPLINWKRGLSILILVALPVVLVLKQPDIGSASVFIAVSLILVLAARIPKAVIISGALMVLIAAPLGYRFLAPYQRDRIRTYLEPEYDPTGIGYNVNQSKIAIGSGGIFGRGLGQGSQSQLKFLPVAHTDFIFAGFAESFGFVGSVAVLILLGSVVVRAFYISRLSQDSFGMYLALGISGLYLYQIFINIGGNLGLVPVTGIPLPFMSYGGTAMIVNLAALGLLESIYLRHKKIRFG